MRRRTSGYLIEKYPTQRVADPLNKLLRKPLGALSRGELRMLDGAIRGEKDRRGEPGVPVKTGLRIAAHVDRIVRGAAPLALRVVS